MNAAVIRLYFNKRDDFPRVWSIDFGAGTAEILLTGVSVDAPGEAVYQEGVVPCAWIQFNQSHLDLIGAKAVIGVRR